MVTTVAHKNQTLVPEAEEQLHRHVKPLVIGSNPVCPTYGTVAQLVEQVKTLFRYSRAAAKCNEWHWCKGQAYQSSKLMVWVQVPYTAA